MEKVSNKQARCRNCGWVGTIKELDKGTVERDTFGNPAYNIPLCPECKGTGIETY